MKCSMCDCEMVPRIGRYGAFWACPNSTKLKPHPTKSTKSAPSYYRSESPSWSRDSYSERIRKQWERESEEYMERERRDQAIANERMREAMGIDQPSGWAVNMG